MLFCIHLYDTALRHTYKHADVVAVRMHVDRVRVRVYFLLSPKEAKEGAASNVLPAVNAAQLLH